MQLASRVQDANSAVSTQRGRTVQLAAHQLHAQRARLSTHHGDEAEVLRHDGRVKEVGLGAVVVRVSHKHLPQRDGQSADGVLRAEAAL